MMRAHGTKKTAVRDTAAVQDITATVDHKTDVLNFQPSSEKGEIDCFRDEVGVLGEIPGRPQLADSAGDNGHTFIGVRHVWQATRFNQVFGSELIAWSAVGQSQPSVW